MHDRLQVVDRHGCRRSPAKPPLTRPVLERPAGDDCGTTASKVQAVHHAQAYPEAVLGPNQLAAAHAE